MGEGELFSEFDDTPLSICWCVLSPVVRVGAARLRAGEAIGKGSARGAIGGRWWKAAGKQNDGKFLLGWVNL